MGNAFVRLCLVAVLAVSASACAESEDEAGSAEPAATEASKPEASSTTEKPVNTDTGRMSEGEFESFSSAHQKVVRESLQFSNEVQACAAIGQTLDLAGFRECMDDAYSGFEDGVALADFTTGETLDDTAKQCQAALRSYRKVLADLGAAVGHAYDVADRLAFDSFEAAYNELPRASNRYAKFSTNALAACEPR